MEISQYMPSLPNKLFRFSKLDWMEDTLNRGRFRLNSASYIESLKGDSARQDNETNVEYKVASNKVTVTHVKSGIIISTISGVTFQSLIDTDYYLRCFSSQCHSYMYDEFSGSEACLVIHDPEELRNRIYNAAHAILPSWTGIDAAITYEGSSKYGAPFEKIKRYMFQWEWRFAWIPGLTINTQRNLPCLFLEIGSLEDIGEIIQRPHVV